MEGEGRRVSEGGEVREEREGWYLDRLLDLAEMVMPNGQLTDVLE